MSRLHLTLLVAVLAVLAALPSAASARPRALDLDACPELPAAQVFLPFADPAFYVLAEGGTFETKLPGWSFSRAGVVGGNEPFHLHAAADKRSLALRPGGVATSSRNCISLARPTLRFVVRSTGSPLAMLLVSAVVEHPDGTRSARPVGVVSGVQRDWAPSLPMALLESVSAELEDDGTAAVRFRFEVLGDHGAFQVDDLYIDPYRKG